MKNLSHLLLPFVLFLLWSPISSQSLFSLEWEELSSLPSSQSGKAHLGLAGAFAGVHNNALIMAGGANFPDKAPWEGGQKVWWDEIYVMDGENEDQGFIRQTVKLPQALAYGVSIPTDKGLLCIGGEDSSSVSNRVFLLQWNRATQEVTIEYLPNLPRPLAFMAGTSVGQTVYVVGGKESKAGDATHNFWSLDLSKDDLVWEERSPFAAPPRLLPLATTQSNGQTDCLYLFSGRRVEKGKGTQVLSDAYEFNPTTNSWQSLPDIKPKDGEERSIMAGTCVSSGANHLLFFGGADGKILLQLEALAEAIASANDTIKRQELEQEQKAIFEEHPGFSKDILTYHTITKSWAKIGELPFTSPVTTTAIKWDDRFILPSGEIQPGIRTPKVWQATAKPDFHFGWINFSILGIYLLLLVGMGVYFAKNEASTDDYFKAGGRIPWWAAGLSIFGTQLSAITFMAIPAKTFATDWSYFIFNMGIILVAPLIIFAFLPLFRRMNITTAYEYLEQRFNLLSRLMGSAMFVLLQFGRIGIVLFLPSLALSMVTGIDVITCILVMGILSIAYTVMGGIEAVIWTDVFQVIILVGGALLSMIWIIAELDGGATALIELAKEDYKLQVFDFRFDFSTPTFWVVLLGGISSSIVSYGSDQSVVQRYLTTNSEKSAAKSIWTNALLSIPSTLIFFSIGTALYVLYKTHPLQLDPLALQNTDAIFPYFIVTQLPQGVAGLLIAGVFSAAMSSLDSSMNSVASALTTDFYQRFRPNKTEGQYLYFARWITALVGIAGTVLALLMASWNIKSLWDQLNTFIGLFAGGLGGLFLLGLFTKRANGTGAVIGLIASAIVQYYVKTYTDIFLLLYTFSGLLSCFVIGYLASLFFPTKEGAKI